MPGRSCTGNPNHTGTVSMPCRNTWLLCLPANFQQKHKVERERRKHTHTVGGRREGERGCKREKKRCFCSLLTIFAECFWGLVPKSQTERGRAQCPHFTQILSEVFVSAQQAEPFDPKQHFCDKRTHCSGDAKKKKQDGPVKKWKFSFM